ncbi:uncharacterized protein LOC110859028 [Folsomia candida]|uniref:Uncharacterized protein n=1 Tax=Folsomia candida TaxID=158441 RepID=A0A226DE83_FOLCA|nr:uncharacterized protein LOC110859028 [Folsomia candida]OXA43164.1 hypothetical protein Fcan01_22076 [Folsomia candida]
MMIQEIILVLSSMILFTSGTNGQIIIIGGFVGGCLPVAGYDWDCGLVLDFACRLRGKVGVCVGHSLPALGDRHFCECWDKCTSTADCSALEYTCDRLTRQQRAYPSFDPASSTCGCYSTRCSTDAECSNLVETCGLHGKPPNAKCLQGYCICAN